MFSSDDKVGIVVEADAQLLAGLPPVVEEAFTKRVVEPGARHDFRAERGRAGIEHFDLPANFLGREEAAFDQKLLKCSFQQLIIARLTVVRDRRVVMIVIVIMIVVMGGRHGQILSSQFSKTSMLSLSWAGPA